MKTICDISLKESLNLEEAIAYLGCGNHNTFKEWRENGEIAYYKIGRRITYSRKSLDKFLEKRKQL